MILRYWLKFFIILLGLMGPVVFASDFSALSSKNIEETLKPLQNIPENDLLAQVKENAQGTLQGPIFIKYPLVPVFIVKMIKDKKALPYLAKILEDKDRLYTYLGFMVLTFFLGIVTQKMFTDKYAGFFESVFRYLLHYVFLTAVRLAITYYMFANELDPTIKVFNTTFL